MYAKHRKNKVDKGCPLCNAEGIKVFNYWKIIKNKFPYDRISEVHDMILPIRHATENELTKEEWDEYNKLRKGFLNENYTYFIEASMKTKTIPSHLHIHLINVKRGFLEKMLAKLEK